MVHKDLAQIAELAQPELASIGPTLPVLLGLLPGMEDTAEAWAHPTPGQRMRFVDVVHPTPDQRMRFVEVVHPTPGQRMCFVEVAHSTPGQRMRSVGVDNLP